MRKNSPEIYIILHILREVINRVVVSHRLPSDYDTEVFTDAKTS